MYSGVAEKQPVAVVSGQTVEEAAITDRTAGPGRVQEVMGLRDRLIETVRVVLEAFSNPLGRDRDPVVPDS